MFEDISLGQGVDNTCNYLIEHTDTLDRIIEMCYNIVNNNKNGKELILTEDEQELNSGETILD